QEGGDTFSGESNHPPENPATKRSHRPMEKITQSARESSASGPVWETLEQYARGEIQQFVQRLLEEEVEELLGRAKSERRGPEPPRGLRNGYGKPRQLALMNGTPAAVYVVVLVLQIVPCVRSRPVHAW